MYDFILIPYNEKSVSLLNSVYIKPSEIVIAEPGVLASKKGELPKDFSVRTTIKAMDTIIKNKPVISISKIVALGRRILPKAENNKDVEKFLTLMSGRRHSIYTTIAIRVNDGTIYSKTILSKVKLKNLTEKEIKDYINLGEGIGSDGGYDIEGYARSFVIWMSGSFDAILGMPFYQLRNYLTTYCIKNE